MALIRWAGRIDDHWMVTGTEWQGRSLPTSVGAMWKWYTTRSAAARIYYTTHEVGILLVAAAIPVTGVLGASIAVPSILGAIVVFLSGVRNVLAFHETWIGYARTRYALEREAVRWAHKTPPYDASDPDGILANTAQSIAEVETKSWVERRRAAARDFAESRGDSDVDAVKSSSDS